MPSYSLLHPPLLPPPQSLLPLLGQVLLPLRVLLLLLLLLHKVTTATLNSPLVGGRRTAVISPQLTW